MTMFQIFSWNGIPTGVRATDENGPARVELSSRFQVAIDDIAMQTGRTGSEDYLADWEWSSPEERPGSADEVAKAVAGELEKAHPAGRLAELRRELVAELGEGDR